MFWYFEMKLDLQNIDSDSDLYKILFAQNNSGAIYGLGIKFSKYFQLKNK